MTHRHEHLSRLFGLVASLVCLQAAGCGGVSAPPAVVSAPAPGHVTIVRDSWGVPHVFAQLETDGLFGVGYALAEDNLEQILFRYVVLNARTAEIFGEQYAGSDLFVKRYRILEESRAAFDGLPADIRGLYEAYIKGLKRFMDDHPTRLPSWWDSQFDLEPALPTAFWYWVSLVLSVHEGLADCRRGGLEIDLGLRDRGFVRNEPFDARLSTSVASNQFVLMNSRTSGDEVFLVNDNHTTFEARRSELRLHAGSLHAAGITVAGYPLPGVGHTRNIAWAHTTGGPDNADCFEFDLDPEDSGRYLFDGQSLEFAIEEIGVAIDGMPSQIVAQKYVRKSGLLLPVLAQEHGKAYAVATGDMRRAGALDRSYLKLFRAATVDDVLRALEEGHFVQNVMAADTNGDTIYVRAAITPIRADGEFDWRRPVPGSTSATDWQGVHPINDLVQVRNPATGYMQNNNVSVDRMTAAQTLPDGLRAGRYLGYIVNGEGRDNARGRRAIELLSSASATTFEEFTAFVFDEKWISATKWATALSGALAAETDWSERPAAVREFAARLESFDGFASRESVAALSFFVWIGHVAAATEAEALLAAVLGDRPLTSDQRDALVVAVERAFETMESRYGGADVAYGDAFAIGRGDTSKPVGGGPLAFGQMWYEPTIRAHTFSPRPDAPGQFAAAGGQINPIVMRLEIGGSIDSVSLVPFGQRHDPESRHYSDQSALASSKKPKPSLFDPDALAAHVESVVTLDVR